MMMKKIVARLVVTRVSIKGDGSADVDLYIYNHQGQLVDKDSQRQEDCVIHRLPKHLATFSVKVADTDKSAKVYWLFADRIRLQPSF
jgi:hypothetical protein